MTDDVTRFEIAKLELREGDSLVVKSDLHLSLEQRKYIEQSLRRFVPDHVKVIVLDSGLTLEVLRQTDQAG
jgi:hypothetical protein